MNIQLVLVLVVVAVGVCHVTAFVPFHYPSGHDSQVDNLAQQLHTALQLKEEV